MFVVGTGFVDTPTTRCLYRVTGEKVALQVKTTYVNSTHIKCELPASASSIEAEVSLNFCDETGITFKNDKSGSPYLTID